MQKIKLIAQYCLFAFIFIATIIFSRYLSNWPSRATKAFIPLAQKACGVFEPTFEPLKYFMDRDKFVEVKCIDKDGILKKTALIRIPSVN